MIKKTRPDKSFKTSLSTLQELKEIEQEINSALDAIQLLEHSIKDRTAHLKKSLNLIKHQATHDFLTGMPNQLLLVEQMNLAIENAKQNQGQFAVIYFSLNEIEKINNGLGHHASALALRMIADRLKKTFHKDKKNLLASGLTIKFFHPREFVILIEPVSDTETIEAIAENFFRVLDEPVDFGKQLFRLTASMGISLYPHHGQDIKALLMNADAARLHAKQHGGNKIEVYKNEINQDAFRQLEIESHLHVAIKNNELRLRYQPFIELKSGKICGMEALVYWKNPVLGLVSPAEFIPLAETNGMIVPLGEWVFRNACAQIKLWHEQGFIHLKLAINLSAKQLHQKNIVKIVAHILEEVNLGAQHVELELTETEAFKEDVIPVVEELKALGFDLSIDDFGTGHSGLKNLKTFSIDKLKIDKAFVQDIDHNEHSQIIAENTIALAKKMHIHVLAEGVETDAQLKFLTDHGCDMIQGYYFSPPLSPDEFTELLMSE